MSTTNRSQFVYVTYIRTTPAKLWEALTDPQFMKQYWFGVSVESAWKKGAPWKLIYPDGRTSDSGEILESDPPRRMVIRWQNEWNPEFNAEGPSRCTMELEPTGKAVKLTITHEVERSESKFIASVTTGWPLVLSNLKSLLETGELAMVERPKA
jgi:uncharacterized protein YndB with AHSA1/START domain